MLDHHFAFIKAFLVMRIRTKMTWQTLQILTHVYFFVVFWFVYQNESEKQDCF